MASKAWVVLSVGYEYNDETYSRGESGGGNPIHIYTDKKEAEKQADELNLKELRSIETIVQYGESIYDIVKGNWQKKGEREKNVALVTEWFNSRGVTDLDYPIIPKKTSDKDLTELYNLLDLEFFTVVETKID